MNTTVRRFRLLSLGLLALVLSFPSVAAAAVQLHRLFTDNGILQRGTAVPVWGTTDAAEPVTVKFAGKEATATPADGKWRVELPALEANATPQDLVVQQGDQAITLKNIVVGDVWLCGGQSNMQWSVAQCAGADEAISASTNPRIRLFTVNRKGLPQPQTDLDGGNWAEAAPDVVRHFSAVGYYFGRDLEKDLQVPIGLISSNIGGTTAERWMSAESISSNPKIEKITAPQGKSDLYNAMIAPLAPYAIKGAIWYQGESNAYAPFAYRHVLGSMIADWRKTFGQPELPFLIVELAPFTQIMAEPSDQDWPVVRESMQVLAKEMPKVATVSIVDVGDQKDIHPQQKQPVGARLALAAKKVAYGQDIVSAGPQFESLSINGNKAIIKFKNAGEGLELRGDALTGFTLAGEDKKFHNAQATIEGDTVVVTCEQVPNPVAVRFGWANFPVVNLWNKNGLPAHPFRTDDWPVAKQDAL
jgi:sialate O-acetylesterase